MMANPHDPATGEQSHADPSVQSENTGEPTPSANQGEALSIDAIRGALGEIMAPISDRLTHLENRDNAARRRGEDSRTVEPADSDGKGEEVDDLAKLPKRELLARLDQMSRETTMLRKAEDARAASESANKVRTELRGLITAGNFANTDLLEELILPKLKLSQDGRSLIYDDGERVRSAAEMVREIGARDVFTPPTSGSGAGTRQGETTHGTQAQGSALPLDEAALMSMKPDERMRVMEEFERNHGFNS